MSLSSEDTEAMLLALWNLRYVQYVGMLTDVDVFFTGYLPSPSFELLHVLFFRKPKHVHNHLQ